MKKDLKIWEGVESTWHYHLSSGGRDGVLCGNTNVMPTNLPLDTWGMKSEHIPESYCKECERLANESDSNG